MIDVRLGPSLSPTHLIGQRPVRERALHQFPRRSRPRGLHFVRGAHRGRRRGPSPGPSLLAQPALLRKPLGPLSTPVCRCARALEAQEPARWSFAERPGIGRVAAAEEDALRTAPGGTVGDPAVATEALGVAVGSRAIVDHILPGIRPPVVLHLPAIHRTHDVLGAEVHALRGGADASIAPGRASGKGLRLEAHSDVTSVQALRALGGGAAHAHRLPLCHARLHRELVRKDIPHRHKARLHQCRVLVGVEQIVLRGVDHQIFEGVQRNFGLVTSHDGHPDQRRLRLGNGWRHRRGID
mmetsp:Transcript_78131/g.253538  ORF Transcript_78131/g.253538 Transcript_78131/m.253538 type:complete len:297 (-) Transcript_78131:1369-2259(-)